MLKLIFSVIVYAALTVFIILLIIDIVRLSKKIKKTVTVRNITNMSETEAEVKSGVFRDMSKSKDKEFLLLLSYKVDGIEYSKELNLYYPPNTIVNLLVGAKVTLVYDQNDPNLAVLKDGKEETLKMLRNYDIAYICCALIVALVLFFAAGLDFNLV